MSAMMAAASAPSGGPVAVPQQQQQQQQHNPANVTMRGHHRQPSSGRPPPSGGPSARAAGPSGGPQGRAVGSGPRAQVPATAQQQQRPTYPAQPPTTAGPSSAQRTTQQHPVVPTQAARPSSSSGNVVPPPLNPQKATNAQQSQAIAKNSSFPHAFERWEMLSSRWEGLTGYWVSRLEQNRQELSHLPIEQEMSRQITDLAAAGANLFQALIELQRLRASSERKFQRWFFETRADQERAREMSSELERSLRVERQQRADALAQVKQVEKEKLTAEKMVEETRRELQISREECRRAWEELGRREQEEREITTSLKDGHPALVGGVQVTPMPMPGVPSRSNSQANRPRTSGGPPPPQQKPQSPLRQEHSADDPPARQAHREDDVADFLRGPTSTTGATARTTTAGTPSPNYPPPSSSSLQGRGQQSEQTGFYQQIPTSLHETSEPQQPHSPVSYGTNPNVSSPTISAVSEVWETDEQGNVVLDETGHPALARRPGENDEEYHEREWGTYPSYDGNDYGGNGSSGGGGGYDSGGGSGGGGGVGIGTGWESVPRHHHPTRLSDVLEEDERATVSDGRRSGLG